jgi:two-component system OmpR family response regulator
MKILLVEDDVRISEPLAEALSDQHYVVETAIDGEMGWELICTFTYDLVILDIMLPKLDGLALCHQLRQAHYSMPILMLTARDTSLDKVMSLDSGADDYVVKPFDLKELLARIRALLRRGSPALLPILEWGELRLDPAACEATYAKQRLPLTPKEYNLLVFFLRHPHQVLSQDELLSHLWSSEDPPGKETVKVHIRGLRQKLKQMGASDDCIETIYGLGYRLNPHC